MGISDWVKWVWVVCVECFWLFELFEGMFCCGFGCFGICMCSLNLSLFVLCGYECGVVW